jgi:PD-(D/E)XK nuclease superfamily
MKIFDAIKLENLEENKETSSSSNLTKRFSYKKNKIAKVRVLAELNLVLQQISMGLSLDSLFIEYPQVKKAATFAQPYIDIPGSKYWDEYLLLNYQNIRLQAQYDLIVYDDNQVTGIDWRNQIKNISPQELEKSMSTQLQLFILCETTNLAPEQISLIYLNLDREKVCQFAYSSEKHSQFQNRINSILQEYAKNKQKKTQKQNLQTIHEKWINKEITTDEYIDAIPEVEI